MTISSGSLAIAICQRCNRKFDYQDLMADGNTPALRVCEDCYDHYDPWRLPPPQPDPLILRFPRPDVPLDVPVDEVTAITPDTPSFLGVNFPGTAFLTRAAPLTSVVDSATGLLSFWYKPTLDGQAETILTNDIARLIVDRTGALLRVRLVGTSIGNFFRGSTGNAIVAGSSYINILATWNTNAVAGLRTMQIYVNDVSDCTIDLDVGIAFSADLATGVSDYGIGTADMATAALNGDLAEFYFAPGQFLDLTVAANRRLFITADLQPVDLGTTGSIPTGAAPAIYQSFQTSGQVTDFVVNRATGGGQTLTGLIAPAATQPGES